MLVGKVSDISFNSNISPEEKLNEDYRNKIGIPKLIATLTAMERIDLVEKILKTVINPINIKTTEQGDEIYQATKDLTQIVTADISTSLLRYLDDVGAALNNFPPDDKEFGNRIGIPKLLAFLDSKNYKFNLTVIHPYNLHTIADVESKLDDTSDELAKIVKYLGGDWDDRLLPLSDYWDNLASRDLELGGNPYKLAKKFGVIVKKEIAFYERLLKGGRKIDSAQEAKLVLKETKFAIANLKADISHLHLDLVEKEKKLLKLQIDPDSNNLLKRKAENKIKKINATIHLAEKKLQKEEKRTFEVQHKFESKGIRSKFRSLKHKLG
ncbi:MAG: hypothetical protein H0W88_06225 [Parachlamydiaceae bacterium]|nr:hypothetical protein [Parachlamydiaceae bacterium]